MKYAMGMTLNKIEERINYFFLSDLGAYEAMSEYYGIKEDIERALARGIISTEQAKRLNEMLNM